MPQNLIAVALLARAAPVVPAQSINIVAATNSADFQPGLPQGGSLASIFCTGLQGAMGLVYAPPRYPLPVTLRGVAVWINSLPAPILAIAFEEGYQQINVQVPWKGPEGPSSIEVTQNGQHAGIVDPNAWVDFPGPAAFKWTVFFASATNYAVVQHASGCSLVTPQSPAHTGEFLVAYGINLGPVGNTPSDGSPAPFNPLAQSQAPVSMCRIVDTVEIGTAAVTPTYVGLVPGQVGVYQINFQVPDNVTAGEQSLTFTRNLQIGLFGQCPGNGLGTQWTSYLGRPVLLPVE